MLTDGGKYLNSGLKFNLKTSRVKRFSFNFKRKCHCENNGGFEISTLCTRRRLRQQMDQALHPIKQREEPHLQPNQVVLVPKQNCQVMWPVLFCDRCRCMLLHCYLLTFCASHWNLFFFQSGLVLHVGLTLQQTDFNSCISVNGNYEASVVWKYPESVHLPGNSHHIHLSMKVNFLFLH